eukprot:9475946-Pyramimonas_sp.AAC.2
MHMNSFTSRIKSTLKLIGHVLQMRQEFDRKASYGHRQTFQAHVLGRPHSVRGKWTEHSRDRGGERLDRIPRPRFHCVPFACPFTLRSLTQGFRRSNRRVVDHCRGPPSALVGGGQGEHDTRVRPHRRRRRRGGRPGRGGQRGV